MKIITWSNELNLDEFYAEAARRGFDNNSSQKKMIDCLKNELEWQVWILYKNDRAVGSVASHTFDIMGPNSYRICVRNCAFPEALPKKTFNKKYFTEYQNISAQVFIPTCIKWVGIDKNLYITTNELEVGSQRLVHRIYMPSLEKQGVAKRIKEVFYRNTYQTVWQLYPVNFLEEINKYPRWQVF